FDHEARPATGNRPITFRMSDICGCPVGEIDARMAMSWPVLHGPVVLYGGGPIVGGVGGGTMPLPPEPGGGGGIVGSLVGVGVGVGVGDGDGQGDGLGEGDSEGDGEGLDSSYVMSTVPSATVC